MIPVRFKVEPDKQLTVYLRDTGTAFERDGEAIVDVNLDGRWIRGLELIGSADFNLARAVKPFHPKRLLKPAESASHTTTRLTLRSSTSVRKPCPHLQG